MCLNPSLRGQTDKSQPQLGAKVWGTAEKHPLNPLRGAKLRRQSLNPTILLRVRLASLPVLLGAPNKTGELASLTRHRGETSAQPSKRGQNCNDSRSTLQSYSE